MRYPVDQTMMETAIVWSNRSYAKRKKTAAILAKDGRILLCAYNGTLPGTDNNCESEEDCPECSSGIKKDLFWFCDCTNGKVLVTKPEVIHAERNLIFFAAKNGISTTGCTMYITLSPCLDCASAIVASGIIRVVYLEEYRLRDGIDFLQNHGVQCEKYTGNLFDWGTNEQKS